MHFKRAITREPGKDFASGLTTANLGSPKYELIIEQHQAYVTILRDLGLEVTLLPPLPGFPDAYFVEDVAVITPEIAVITNPGALARRGEKEHIEQVLAQYRPLAHIEPPGTLDGGDVLALGSQYYIGISARTNEEGAGQLKQILHGFGYACTTLRVRGGLHLKSDISYVGRNTLLLTETLAGSKIFEPYERILIEEDEAYAANSLLINNHLLVPKGFPKTKNILVEAHFDIVEVEISEMQKMDGGLSCMSLRF
jgi:dimethylargininase